MSSSVPPQDEPAPEPGTPAPTPAPAAAPEPGVAELRERLTALEAQETREAPRRHRGRSLLAVLLVLLACVLTPVGIVGLWAKSQVGDTDRYLATVGPLAQDPAVQAAVTDRVTNAIMSNLPVDALITNITPADRPLLDALIGQVGGAINSGLTGLVHSQVEKVVASDTFDTVWIDINRAAHAAVERVVTGEGGGAVQVDNDTVSLDLAPVIAQVKTRLVADGLPFASKIPEVHTDFTLIRSDSIAKARTGLRALELAGGWPAVAAVLCAVGGVLVAGRRRRATVTAALGMAAGALLLGLGLSVFRAVYLDRLPSGVDQAAASAVYDALVHFLRAGVRTVVVLGLLVAVGAWLSGTGRAATLVRGVWQAGFGAVRSTLERTGLRLGPVGRFVHRWKAGLGWAAVGAAVLAFLLWSYPTAVVALWMAVVLVLALGILELLDDPGESALPSDDSFVGKGV